MKFKSFAIPAQNSTIDFDGFSIGLALLNLFHKPILSDKMHDDIADIMKSRLNVPNRLKEAVEEFSLSQVKKPYIYLAYTLLDNTENNAKLGFPNLTLNDLYNLSLGPYQIENAASYYAEHKKEGTFLVKKFSPPSTHRTSSLDYTKYGIDCTEPLLIKAFMNSRYCSGKHHHIFILIDKAKAGRHAISVYFCTCESGSRTVGCCGHIMSVVWYLGYAQYNEICKPNPSICDVLITIEKTDSNPN